VRASEPPGMGQLQTDQQVVRAAKLAGVGFNQRLAQADQVWQCVLVDHQLVGVRPSIIRTATASPPQISFAPLSPKCCQRRKVSSEGRPSACRPSLPSAKRRSGCRSSSRPLPEVGPAVTRGRAGPAARTVKTAVDVDDLAGGVGQSPLAMATQILATSSGWPQRRMGSQTLGDEFVVLSRLTTLVISVAMMPGRTRRR
jgi:hypothetical protein